MPKGSRFEFGGPGIGEQGDFAILIHHMPIIAKLRPGKVIVSVHNEPELVFEIEGGYLEMADNHCVILASGG